jgi:protein gp37
MELLGRLGPVDLKFCDRCQTTWPLRNLTLGVSVTDQRTADQRIPILRRTPSAHRFVSIAPMRGPVVIDSLDGIDAVIVEGQSGPQAVPLDLGWVRAIRDQCQAAGVVFAFKQGSGRNPTHEPLLDGVRWPISGLPWMGGQP